MYHESSSFFFLIGKCQKTLRVKYFSLLLLKQNFKKFNIKSNKK